MDGHIDFHGMSVDSGVQNRSELMGGNISTFYFLVVRTRLVIQSEAP